MLTSTLLVRDQQSFNFAQQELDVSTFLCPDMAFVLGSIERPCPPQTEIVWLSRTDKEALNRLAPQNEPGIIRTDWVEELPTLLMECNEQLSRELKLYPERAEMLYDQLFSTYDPIAQERFLRGCMVLSQGKVVITDRLHGHIMCLLLGIPHVLMDNNYGKVKGFYEAWTKGNELTIWADSPEEIVDTSFHDPQFRTVLQKEGIDLTDFDHLADRLKKSLHTGQGWATSAEIAKKAWVAQVDQTKQEILALTTAGEPFILVDDEQIRSALSLGPNTAIPFPEQEYEYAGPPTDDVSAIREIERQRTNGATHIIFAWPAFWWLDHYSAMYEYLKSTFKCVIQNERLIGFHLGKS